MPAPDVSPQHVRRRLFNDEFEQCIVCFSSCRCAHVRPHGAPRGGHSPYTPRQPQACGPYPICVPCGERVIQVISRDRGKHGQFVCPVCRKCLGSLRRSLVEGAGAFELPVSPRASSVSASTGIARLLVRLGLDAESPASKAVTPEPGVRRRWSKKTALCFSSSRPLALTPASICDMQPPSRIPAVLLEKFFQRRRLSRKTAPSSLVGNIAASDDRELGSVTKTGCEAAYSALSRCHDHRDSLPSHTGHLMPVAEELVEHGDGLPSLQLPSLAPHFEVEKSFPSYILTPAAAHGVSHPASVFAIDVGDRPAEDLTPTAWSSPPSSWVSAGSLCFSAFATEEDTISPLCPLDPYRDLTPSLPNGSAITTLVSRTSASVGPVAGQSVSIDDPNPQLVTHVASPRLASNAGPPGLPLVLFSEARTEVSQFSGDCYNKVNGTPVVSAEVPISSRCVLAEQLNKPPVRKQHRPAVGLRGLKARRKLWSDDEGTSRHRSNDAQRRDDTQPKAPRRARVSRCVVFSGSRAAAKKPTASAVARTVAALGKQIAAVKASAPVYLGGLAPTAADHWLFGSLARPFGADRSALRTYEGPRVKRLRLASQSGDL